ncbi:hypothetical protein P7H70_04635 [Vagococcus carniphilus]|uniref:Extracellular matrix-binding protein ebh GA module domain-containing protein n=1 Tax=Vagococcus carniphilus TaxID=218144 RepID=A0AAW8U5R4_9ENTE|nr:hypothetical protein [Vagococcus carniphilus]MDT2833331.1 hypothetical protein [Vagococcus carniphilus]
MKDNKKNGYVPYEVQQDYKPKLVRGRNGWVIKGLVYLSLIGVGIVTTNGSEVQAAEWRPNTAEEIREKINETDTSYTFAEGDTFYEIGRAINVKHTVLMELNGFEEGSQYTVPIGTTITFDGQKITLTDKDGKVLNEQILSDGDKVDKGQPFMNQTSNPVIGKSTDSATNKTKESTEKTDTTPVNQANYDNSKHSNQRNPTKSVDANPDKPIKPIKPIKPTVPVKPIEPKPEENRLEELKKQLADLEAQLGNKQVELEAAFVRLNEANAKNKENSIISANAQMVVNELVDKLAVAEATIIAAQNSVVEAQSAIDAWKPTEEENEVPTRLNEALINAQAGLEVAQANKQAILNEQVIALQALEEAKQLPVIDANSIAEETSIINDEINHLQQKIDEIQAEIAKLEGSIKPEEENGLEKAKQSAVETLANLNLLPEELTDFKLVIQAAQSVDEINNYIAQAQTAHEKNEAIVNESEELKKEKANASIQLDSLNLNSEDKEILIYQINSATNLADINDILTHAQSLSTENDKKEEAEKSKLEAVKLSAQKEIKTLHLLEEEQATFLSLVTNAKSVSEVSDALENAHQVSNKNNQNEQNQLEKVKNEAIASLEKLNLTEAEKSAFKNRIKTVKKTIDINSILNEAVVNSNKNDEAVSKKELNDAKKQAKSDLSKMNLIESQQSEFDKQIDEAKTVSLINTIVAKAKQVSDKNNEETANKEKLEKEKEQAKQKITQLEYLPEANKKDVNGLIDKANTSEEINKIVVDAKKQDDQFKQDKETSEKLETTRKNALKELAGLNLKGNKSFEEQIKIAKTEAQIASVLEAAKVESAKNDKTENTGLESQKKSAIDVINGMSHITDTQKQTFISQINRAKTKDRIDKIIGSATKENEVIDYIEDYKEISVETVKEVVQGVQKGLVDDYTVYDSIESILSKKTDTTDEVFEKVHEEIKKDINYEIYESDYEKLQVYFEINDRYTKRMIENINTLRSELGLSPLNYIELSDKAKAAMFAHTIAEGYKKEHLTSNNSSVLASELGNNGENMIPLSSAPVSNVLGIAATVEELADIMFKKELNESEFYSTEGNKKDGHLHNIIKGKSNSIAYGALVITGIKNGNGPFGRDILYYDYSITEIFSYK